MGRVALEPPRAEIIGPNTDDPIIGSFVRPTRTGESEDLYEPWAGDVKTMLQAAAEPMLDACVRRWPDFEFETRNPKVTTSRMIGNQYQITSK